MLPYADLTQNEARNFITDFEYVDDNKIKVNFANNDFKLMDKNPGNIEKLLLKMQKQVIAYHRDNKDMLFMIIKTILLLEGSNIMASKLMEILITSSSFKNQAVFGLLALTTFSVCNNLANSICIKEDIAKNRLFLTSSYTINTIFTNDELRQVLLNSLCGSRKYKLVSKLENMLCEEGYLNINNIKNLTFFDIKSILHSIDDVKKSHSYKKTKRR